jgi:hypothetical protein
LYDNIIELCRTQTEVILQNVNPNALDTGEVEARHMKYKRLELGDSQTYNFSADQL